MKCFEIILTTCLALALIFSGGCSAGAQAKSSKEPKTASPRHLTLDLGKGVTMTFALVPEGKFMMGGKFTPTQAAKLYGGKEMHYTSEHPRRKVTISKPFYMGVYEVTQAQWTAVMGSKPWDGKVMTKSGADYPASWVNWNKATEFCGKLSKKIGKRVTLPSEAQWEYACRAGSETVFCFGDDAKDISHYAWWRGNMHKSGKAKSYAQLVGRKKPNAWGLYDMHGNVWEWCRDWYHKDAYAGGKNVDPEYTKETKTRGVRGGSWYNDPCHLRSAARNSWCSPKYVHYNYGFRVMVAPK